VQSPGVLLRQLVTSKCLSSFLPVERYARPRLPSGGSFGPRFPTFSGTMLGYDCPLPLSVSCAFARSPIPCLFRKFVSFLQARCRSGTLASTPGLLGHPVHLFREADKETSGSPKFPGYPSKRMPRSPTPVVSSALALTHSGLLPSTRMTVSAFLPIFLAVIHCPRLYKFRGSITRPVLSLPLASDARYRVCPQGSLLVWWLTFDQMGFAPIR
jgi:hypothetical protein